MLKKKLKILIINLLKCFNFNKLNNCKLEIYLQRIIARNNNLLKYKIFYRN